MRRRREEEGGGGQIPSPFLLHEENCQAWPVRHLRKKRSHAKVTVVIIYITGFAVRPVGLKLGTFKPLTLVATREVEVCCLCAHASDLTEKGGGFCRISKKKSGWKSEKGGDGRGASSSLGSNAFGSPRYYDAVKKSRRGRGGYLMPVAK